MSEEKKEPKVIETPDLGALVDPSFAGPQYRQIYSNSTRMAVTPWDISVTFSSVSFSMTGPLPVQDEVTVVVSPQHAKVLARNWAKTIEVYEKKYGAIADVAHVVVQKEPAAKKKKAKASSASGRQPPS